MNKLALAGAADENDPRETSHGHRRRAEGGRGIGAPPSRLASPLISLCVPALCLSSCAALGTRLAWRDRRVALSCHVVPLRKGLGCNHCPSSCGSGGTQPSGQHRCSRDAIWTVCFPTRLLHTRERRKGRQGVCTGWLLFSSTSKPLIYRWVLAGCGAARQLLLGRVGGEGVSVCLSR